MFQFKKVKQFGVGARDYRPGCTNPTTPLGSVNGLKKIHLSTYGNPMHTCIYKIVAYQRALGFENNRYHIYETIAYIYVFLCLMTIVTISFESNRYHIYETMAYLRVLLFENNRYHIYAFSLFEDNRYHID